MACKKSCPACVCSNEQFRALRKALPHFRPLTVDSATTAKLAERVMVEPERLQKEIDRINDSGYHISFGNPKD
jgi:hypothetical protein